MRYALLSFDDYRFVVQPDGAREDRKRFDTMAAS